VWVMWPSVCVVVVVPYFMMLSCSVLSGDRRIYGRALGVVLCVYLMWLRILVGYVRCCAFVSYLGDSIVCAQFVV
jgi:hypothetical protein